MAKMTMTYRTNINSSDANNLKTTFRNLINHYGEANNINPLNDNTYITNKPTTRITVRSDGRIDITDVTGNQRCIKKIRSRLLKMIEGLKLN